MKLGIVTDSTADLPSYLIEQYALEVVPSILVYDGKEYADGGSISRSDFYRRLPEFKKLPTTAAPSIGEFTTRFQKLLDQGCEHVLSIHAVSTLTSIFSSAGQAAAEFGARVTVLDSRSLSLGLGFQVLAAAEAAENGLQAALAAIQSTRKRLRVFAALDSLEYLRRSGRVPDTVTILGSLLRVKPLIELADGNVKAIGAVRTTKQATERIFSFMKASGDLERLAILHTGAEKRAHTFLNGLMDEMSLSLPRDILLVNVTPVIGAHLGPNGLGFAAVRK